MCLRLLKIIVTSKIVSKYKLLDLCKGLKVPFNLIKSDLITISIAIYYCTKFGDAQITSIKLYSFIEGWKAEVSGRESGWLLRRDGVVGVLGEGGKGREGGQKPLHQIC